MVESGFFPQKKYSQNFLVDEDAVKSLIDSSALKPSDHVLEIGGGTGIVTHAIAQTGAHVTCIELHDTLARHLRERFVGQKNVEIIEGDALRVDLKKIPYTKVVASPPYAISDDIMYALFENGFSHASLIWQIEFAEKILSPPGSSEYHPLSVISQYFYDGKIIRKITPKSFYPIPNQFSALLSLTKRKNVLPITRYRVFVSWLRTLFRFKNKTIGNAIQQLRKNPVKGINVSACEKAAHEMKLSSEKVFLLEPEEFVELFHAIE
jgi:16S rRNA (adenine1518-N6/adenine1519-N6)-dimethyltransferase